MKLHGVAIAAMPQKGDLNVINVTCTPIAVSNANLEKLEILGDLAFKESIALTDTPGLIAAFVKAVNVVDYIVDLQKRTLAVRGLGYRPVALEIGQDHRNPTNVNALYSHLFGERVFPARTQAQIESDMIHEEWDWLRLYVPLSDEARRGTYDDLSKDEQELILQFVRSNPRHKQFNANYLFSENDRMESELAHADAARIGYLHAQGSFPDEFNSACAKLSKLLPQCSLQWGSFSDGSECPLFLLRSKGANSDAPEQSALDKKLVDLKGRLSEDADAHYEIVKLAKEEGKKWGDKLNENPSLFMISPGSREYVANKALQDMYPQRAFFEWDEAYRRAFREGFNESYAGPYSRLLKLPLDPPMPPFADPCADPIRDQFEIIAGRRCEEGIDDAPEWRSRIADLAGQTLLVVDRVICLA